MNKKISPLLSSAKGFLVEALENYDKQRLNFPSTTMQFTISERSTWLEELRIIHFSGRKSKPAAPFPSVPIQRRLFRGSGVITDTLLLAISFAGLYRSILPVFKFNLIIPSPSLPKKILCPSLAEMFNRSVGIPCFVLMVFHLPVSLKYISIPLSGNKDPVFPGRRFYTGNHIIKPGACFQGFRGFRLYIHYP